MTKTIKELMSDVAQAEAKWKATVADLRATKAAWYELNASASATADELKAAKAAWYAALVAWVPARDAWHAALAELEA